MNSTNNKCEFYKFILYFFALTWLGLTSGCSPMRNSQYQEYLSLKYEKTECLSSKSYANSLRVSGVAEFYKRGINLVLENNELKNMLLGDSLRAALPIKFAEIAIYNSKNEIVQCGLTNNSGELKGYDGVADLLIPANVDQLRIEVLARTNVTLSQPGKPDFQMHFAVKKDIYSNEVYALTQNFSSNGVDEVSNLQLTAYARQDQSEAIEGGAFNIFNSIYTAYNYIRNNTGTVDTTCLNDKLNIYWMPGFNPFQYSFPEADPSTLASGSFYNPDEKNLYITGGKLGDISIDVTNHFDDFVIIHELGHHIENQCGQLTTPGGTHSIIVRIDPRLAWSEGWSNYFAAQVMTNSIASLNPEITTKLTQANLPATWTYLFASKGFSDTEQNISNGSGFMFDLKKAGNNPNTWQNGSYIGFPFDKIDSTKYPGEGHFREGAITRGLYKLSNLCGTYCIGASPISFENIWKSMNKITGAGQSVYPFKSSHTVLEILKTLVGAGTWATTYKTFNESAPAEALNLFSDGIFTNSSINRWMPYGTYLTQAILGTCSIGSFYIEPRSDDPVLTGTNSDQRYSNHFYTIDLNTLSGLDQISATFTKQNSSGTNIEFDLLLYKEGYFYEGDYVCSKQDSDGNCTGYSPSRTVTTDALRSDRRGGVSVKTIKNLQELDKSKRYLLNVRAYTANKTISNVTDYSYTITNQNGLTLCP